MSEYGNSEGSTYTMCVFYLAIGILALLANFINLAMYTRSKETRKTYASFIALEIGELINSISFILTGFGRLQSLRAGEFYSLITVHDCFYTKYWPHAQILGTEIPTLFLILTSIERIYAVCWPALFSSVFSERKKGLMMMSCFFIAAVSLSKAAASAFNNGSVNSDMHCGIIHSTAKWYSTFHFIFIVVGYGASLISLVVMKLYRMKAGDSHKQSLRRDTKTNILIAFTAASLLLVAAPSLVMIGLRWEWFALDDRGVALAYSATALVSIANMIINFVFRDDFRQALFHCTNSLGITNHKEEVFAPIHHTTSGSHL